MTNEGFKFLDDIRGDELAATYNLKTNTLEYSPIISKIKYLYKGDMHSYNHKSLDLICTPNHKMLVSLDYKKNKVIRTRNYLIDSSDVLNKKLYYMRYSVENWDGFDCDKIEVADHSFSTKCFARFMGWYLSEGHCVFRGKDDKGRFHASNVCVSQQKKENLQEIFDCMCDLFGKNVTYQYQSVFVVSLDKSWDSFVLWLKSLGTKAWLKVIPQEIKMLSKRFLLEFIDAYLKGDNYYTYLGKETLGKKHTGIITSSSKLRDDFMEIVLKCGLRPSTQTLDNIGRVTYDKRNVRFETHRLTYVVRILTSTKFTSISNHRKILKDWEGEVGCIEVEKNNTIFIRRNGTCIWTGNCKHCIKFYTTQGIGSQPRIFKLNELIDNGSNIGRKQVDWTPTLPGTHPFCRCELHYIPEGYVWDEETKQFQPPKEHKRRVERKSKVKIQVGDKTFEV